jgi:hypothetical protein
LASVASAIISIQPLKVAYLNKTNTKIELLSEQKKGVHAITNVKHD